MIRFPILRRALVLCISWVTCHGWLTAFAAGLQAPSPSQSFAGVGSGTTTNSHYIVTANGTGFPRVNFLNVTSDTTGSNLVFFSSAVPISVTAVSSSGTTNVWAQDGTITNGDLVVIRGVVADQYQRLYVTSATETNWASTTTLSFDLAVGDLVYEQTERASLTVGNATKESQCAGGGGIINGAAARPLLIQLYGASACKINLISGDFFR